MKKQQGFTIMELVVVIALCSVLLLGLLALFDWHSKVFTLEQADVRATGSVRSVMNNMTKYVAQGITLESSRTISGTTYTTDADTVIVKIPSVDSSGNVIASTYDYVAYNLSNGSVTQVIEAGSGTVRTAGSKLLAENVQSFSLTYDNATAALATYVVVDIQTRVTTKGTSAATARSTDTIFLRNH